MNTLFIIALLVQICVRNGFIIQQYSSFKTKLYDIDKNYFGTEYDLEMTPYEKKILDDELSHLFMEQCYHFPNKNDCIKIAHIKIIRLYCCMADAPSLTLRK